jgi:hypothetical protein
MEGFVFSFSLRHFIGTGGCASPKNETGSGRNVTSAILVPSGEICDSCAEAWLIELNCAPRSVVSPKS